MKFPAGYLPEMKLNIGIDIGEVANCVGEKSHHQAVVGAHADGTFQKTVDSRNSLLQISFIFNDLIAIVQNLFSIFRRHDFVLVPDQEGKAHLRFQGVHHMADSRLRIAKLLGGFCQTAGFCDLNESAIF